MAIKEVVVSDLSNREIPDDQRARVVISDHPALKGATVEIDAAAGELEKLQTKKIDLVSIAIHQGAGAPRRVVMEAAEFNAAFKNVDVDALLRNARRVDGASKPRRARGTAPKGERIDYLDPENFGLLHRGRVTEEEASLVRENLDKANANRARAGQSPIDPKDAKEKARYGL